MARSNVLGVLALTVLAAAAMSSHASAAMQTQTRSATFGTTTATSELVSLIDEPWFNLTQLSCGSASSAYLNMQPSLTTALLVVRGFNFSVPATATVHGIRVEWTGRIGDERPEVNRTFANEVALVGPTSMGTPPVPRWNSSTPRTAEMAWTYAWKTLSFPVAGADMMWGLAANASLAKGAGVSSPNFGVAVVIRNMNTGITIDILVSCVRVEVNFTEVGPATTAATSTTVSSSSTAATTTTVGATTTTTTTAATGAGAAAATAAVTTSSSSTSTTTTAAATSFTSTSTTATATSTATSTSTGASASASASARVVDSETRAYVEPLIIVSAALGFLFCVVLAAYTASRYLGWRKDRALNFARGIGLPGAASRTELRSRSCADDDSESEPGSDLDSSEEGMQTEMMNDISRWSDVMGGITVWLDGIVIGCEIGKGNFGSVYLGKWHEGTDVACKVLARGGGGGGGNASASASTSASAANVDQTTLDEAVHLSKLNHPNIVRFFGLFSGAGGDVFIVMEYFKKGSLEAYLRRPEGARLSDCERLGICSDIALGMKFLAARKVAHGDLCARNILVSHTDGAISAKIADFGLSRLCDRSSGGSGGSGGYAAEGDHYCRIPTTMSGDAHKFPVRHSAPEVIESGRYSSQSDVWSFAVVMWEIFSHGAKPFARLTNAEVIELTLSEQHLRQPQNCPDNAYMLMVRCWAKERDRRPSFDTLYDAIRSIARPFTENYSENYNTFNYVQAVEDDNYQTL